MTKVQPLAGNYTRTGKIFQKISDNTLTGNGLMICQRAVSTATKPPLFLLWLDHLQNRTYLSSLYPGGSAVGSYWFDYNGTKYNLTVEGEGVTVTERDKVPDSVSKFLNETEGMTLHEIEKRMGREVIYREVFGKGKK